MVALLIADQAPADGPSRVAVFGGLPTVPAGFAWPVCEECRGAMQFLGQLPRPDRPGALLLLFMCQNDCEASVWEADSGGNAALEVANAVVLAEAPAGGAVVRALRVGARVVDVDAADYDAARSGWAAAHGGSARPVLGQLGGRAQWLQGDQTPTCDACATPMGFVAQLEEGPDAKDAMNFGGGCAYVFQCTCTTAPAKFLSQC